uniref:NOB1 family endonuclease n=1 Tax=Archaeoglobus fulgidus TaxID=2234 RepID=A0A7C3VJQ9_ARCFL
MKCVEVHVIDSSAIFQRKAVYKNMVTVPEVVAEILDEASALYLSVKNLKVEEASSESIEKVKKAAMRTGDIYKLSDTDIKVLAKALDEIEKGNEVVLVTDDYAIQNVAMSLGIRFDGILHRQISKEFKWVKVCRGCGRKIESEVCPVCGSEAVIRRVKNDKN